MPITKAIVPMAGWGTRLYPVSLVLPKGLMPFVLADGTLTTGLQLIAEALLSAGIEQIGLVVSPETKALYERFLAGGDPLYTPARANRETMQSAYEQIRTLAQRITLITQPEPHGLGHAVWCARSFALGEAVLIALGDHLYRQADVVRILEVYEDFQVPLYASVLTPVATAPYYGVLQGQPAQKPNLYRLCAIVEKPSRAYAQAHLRAPNLPEDSVLTHLGLFAFSPDLWEVQAEIATQYRSWGREWYLVDTQQRLMERMPAYLLLVERDSLDFGTPEAYRHAFCTLAGCFDA
ncbi:MAG: hypothetical protein C4336_00480 [Armatimonadota bacterium]